MANLAIIGLGEAGTTYAEALAAAGHRVWGIDPADVATPAGVERVTELPKVPIDAVCVLTSARVAESLSEQLLPSLDAGTVWVDMTTTLPARKAALASQHAHVHHVDIAILGPVILLQTATPLLASGDRADYVAGLFRSFGSPIDVVDDGSPGDAMAHKLLRSVLMKGLAAVVVEAVAAGAAAGREQWIRDQIAGQLAGDGHAVLERFLTGSVKHAARRADEMASVTTYLHELGVPAEISAAAHDQLTRLRLLLSQA